MKKLDTQKTIQLIVFLVLTAACALIIFFNKGLFHTIGTDPGVKLMCGMLWLALGVSFLFIFLDFNLLSTFKQDYRELDYVVHSDPIAGIANRFSSDALIDKYIDKKLPENIGCIMLELTNLKETNKLYGHVEGNQMIRDFSTILKLTSVNLCFVARNGGNKFLAIFEDCTAENLDTFIARVDRKVSSNNSEAGTHPIKYAYGISYNAEDDCEQITDLIALADKRIK